MGSVRYEHAWGLTRSFGLHYGAGFWSRVYDGEREERTWLFLGTDWKL